MKKAPYLELPLLVSLDRFLLKVPEEEDNDETSPDLRQKVIDRAFEILTETQLTVFLMRFAFGLRQRDIATNLKTSRNKKLKLMSKETKCKSLFKQKQNILQYCERNFNKEFLKQLSRIKSDRKKIEKEEAIYLTKNQDIPFITNRQLAQRMATFKLKKEYDRKMKRLLSKFKSKKTLNKELLKHLPMNVTQPYVSNILRICVRKLKKSFEKSN